MPKQGSARSQPSLLAGLTQTNKFLENASTYNISKVNSGEKVVMISPGAKHLFAVKPGLTADKPLFMNELSRARKADGGAAKGPGSKSAVAQHIITAEDGLTAISVPTSVASESELSRRDRARLLTRARPVQGIQAPRKGYNGHNAESHVENAEDARYVPPDERSTAPPGPPLVSQFRKINPNELSRELIETLLSTAQHGPSHHADTHSESRMMAAATATQATNDGFHHHTHLLGELPPNFDGDLASSVRTAVVDCFARHFGSPVAGAPVPPMAAVTPAPTYGSPTDQTPAPTGVSPTDTRPVNGRPASAADYKQTLGHYVHGTEGFAGTSIEKMHAADARNGDDGAWVLLTG